MEKRISLFLPCKKSAQDQKDLIAPIDETKSQPRVYITQRTFVISDTEGRSNEKERRRYETASESEWEYPPGFFPCLLRARENPRTFTQTPRRLPILSKDYFYPPESVPQSPCEGSDRTIMPSPVVFANAISGDCVKRQIEKPWI